MMSMTDYLDRNSCKVLVDNLGKRMMDDRAFDPEGYIRRASAEAYAIGLQ